MNFFKSMLNKFVGKQEETQTNSDLSPNVSVPLEELKELFEVTCIALSKSKSPVSDGLKLQLYGLYKQSTIGDCNTPKPAIYQFANKAKWDAWNNQKGLSKQSAMKNYIALSIKADQNIQSRVQAELLGEEYVQGQGEKIENRYEGSAMKMVQQKDFSNYYSHPYFKAIEKGDSIQNISKQLLLKKNDKPDVFPLHFAIDKERVDLVALFLPLLQKGQIEQMKDGEGTGILEYAELIENEQIIQMVRAKLTI